MTATRTQSELQPWPAADWQPALLLACAGLASALLNAGALWLLFRRMAGAFDHPPAPAALLAAVGVAILLAVAARLCAMQAAIDAPPLFWLWSVPTAGLLLLAIALFPGQAWLWLLVVVAAVAGEEVWAWIVAPPWGTSPLWKRASQAPPPVEPAKTPAVAKLAVMEPEATPGEHDGEESAEEELEEELEEAGAGSLGPDVTHQLTRRVTPAGVEVAGVIQTSFAAGQRTAVEHVAFCPPFDGVPQAEVHQLSGPDARAKVTHALPQGVRIELRLAQVAEEEAAVVHEVRATRAK